MLYSLVGFSSLLICLIINKDIIFNRSDLPKSYRYYRAFLFVIMTFFITDAVWGILDEKHLITLLYIDNIMFFVMMNLSVVFWTKFTAKYVNKSKKMNIALMSAPEELKPEAERVMLRIREDIRDYLTLIKKAQQETPNDK